MEIRFGAKACQSDSLALGNAILFNRCLDGHRTNTGRIRNGKNSHLFSLTKMQVWHVSPDSPQRLYGRDVHLWRLLRTG